MQHRPFPGVLLVQVLAASHLCLFMIASPLVSYAQVETTITSSGLNTQVGTPVTLPNGHVNYDITGGTRPDNGSNLFHSFGEFSIATNNIANFLNEMALPTSNIIGRINGGQASNIWGTIQTTDFAGANLFLVNPSGFIFGPTASLNVGGSFSATTADYLEMTDGAQFYVDPIQPTVLSIAPLAAFGFTAPMPVSISVQATTLQVPTDQTLSLIGGDITITNSVLRAASGQINLASVASTGEVIPNQPGQTPSLDVSSFTNLGQITESSVPGPGFFSNLTVSSSLGAGTIVIRAGGMILNNSFMSAQNTGIVNANPLGYDISVTGDLIFRSTSNALAQTINANGAGTRVSADRLVIESANPIASGYSGFNSSSFGSGRGGDIDITARTIEARGNTNIGSNAFASGPGGNVQINADQLILDSLVQGTYLPRGSTVSSTVSPTGGIGQPGAGTGQGGTVQVNVHDLQVLNGAQILTATQGAGNGGAIDVQADSLLVSGVNLANGAPSSLVSSASGSAASGNGGNIQVHAQTIRVENGGFVRADLLNGSPGNAGSININADTISVSNRGVVAASAVNGIGNAGQISLTARDVRVTGVAGTADPFGFDATGISTATNAGRGGNLILNADRFAVTNNGVITSRSIGSGNAGTVDLHIANDLSLTTGGLISASTSGTGAGGSINVTTPILGLGSAASITAQTSGTGRAGSLMLNTNQLSILSGSQILSSSTSTTTGAGSAGNVTIQGLQGDGSSAQSLLVSGNRSLISTTTAGPGQGGNIQITTSQMQVENLARVSAETSGKGKAGNLTLTGDSLTVTSGGRIEASTAGEGKGGEIVVTTTGDVRVSGVSSDGQTRSGIFAKTQTSGSGTGSGGGGGGSGGGGGIVRPGNAGNITIASKNLLMNDGAQIDSSTTSGGAGGSVAITATENITIAGSSTRLKSDATRGDGMGGNITLVAKNITVREGASVTAATGGRGDAGNVTLTSLDQLLLQSAGTITTSTSGSGNGGTITIQAGQILLDGPGTGITADTLRPFADLTITINILHPNDGDLIVQIDSPTGTRLALLSRVGGTGDNFTNTSFNDQAAMAITGPAPFTGTFKPREPLAQLINELVAGNWTLNVRDQATGNVGSLQSWTLQIGSQTFQSTGGSLEIPDNGNLRSTITVANPTLPTLQGTGEASGIGGNVTINTGTITVQNGATMSATTRGSGQGGTLTVNATGPVVLTGSGSGLFTDSEASGIGGNVNVRAGQMMMSSGASVSAASSGTGDAGQVLLTTPTLDVDDASITTSTSSTGTAGSITANVGALTLTNAAAISSNSTGAATGAAGAATIQGQGGLRTAATAVTLTDSSLLTSAANTGRGGSVTVDATTLTLNNATISASVKNFDNSPGSTDRAAVGTGNVTLTAPTLTMTGGTIAAATTGMRNAGTVSLTAASLNVANGTLTTSTSGSGNAGAITLTTTENPVSLTSGSSITSSTTGAGDAGQVLLTTPTLNVDHASITTSTSGSGNAGTITANVGTVNLTNASTVSSNSTGKMSGAGDAGSVTIAATGSFMSNASTVSTSAENAKGGDILINAQSVQLSNRSLISANSNAPFSEDGAGNAGNITITSASNVIMQNSSVTTEASQASGGQITINAADTGMVRMISSKVVTSVAGSDGDTSGGDILIDPQFVILQNSQILAQAFAGTGGNINIIANVFLQDPNSLVDATSEKGISGTVDIRAPVQNVSGDLVVLSQDFSSAAALLAQQCAARVADGKFSTFVVAAREGLPVEPGGFLSSPSFLTEIGGSVLSWQPSQTTRSAAERSFPEYDAKPFQLAQLGNTCHR